MAEQADKAVVVEAVGLTKVFTDFWGRPKAAAVNGVDFRLHQGEVLGFLGPNGSGKSTTVKMLLGLLNATGGSLKVFGQAPDHVQTKRRIGYLPEETYLYKYLTALETLDFFGALFSLPPGERRRRCETLLEMVGLTHAAHRPVGEFSKGMARRIGLAQALINDPDLVVLDEPTSGLDPIGCQMVKSIITNLAARKKTVILCSHLLADVEDVCSQVLIMYGGRIRARGELRELLKVVDRTRITTPALSPEKLQQVLDLLQPGLKPEEVAVDHPSLSLEDFFISVVRQARAESVATAGTQAEGRIASFLAAEPVAPERVLAQLAAVPAPVDEAPLAPVAAESQPDVAKLSELAATTASETTDHGPAERELTPEEKAAKNRAIEDILRKKQTPPE